MNNLENSEKQKRQLNPYQEAAVMDMSPACIVNANVGSGKTTVLIEKVCFLHEIHKVPYEKMAVLTFTNKAADEIAERLAKAELTEEQLWGFGTFHSVALRLLRRFVSEDFKVIEPDEEMEMLLTLAQEHGYKIKYQNRLKSRMEPDYEAYLQGKEKGKYKDDLFLVFPLLEKQKKIERKMSFADLLREGTKVAKEHQAEIALEWIIVDEVQDSDRKQLEFLEALKGVNTRFFAVGDPNQVIYSWRGTEPNMFFLIKNRFEAKELSLPVNYRSSEVILKAANRFLQFGGKIEGSQKMGEPILVKNHYDPFLEAEYLVERIRKLVEQGRSYKDIAIFYRVQKQAEILEKVFAREEIPFEFPAKKQEDDDPVPEKPHMISETTNEHEKQEAVHLLTLHASKGLEFDYVFIIGMNPGLIPLHCKSMDQEEEERRLFFVGLTRARNNLELSYYTNPAIPGAMEGPSRYLQMIPESLVDWEERPGSETRKKNLQKMRKEAQALVHEKQNPSCRIENRRCRHKKYGEGTMISEDEMMIEVEFPGYGKKQFLKTFGEVEIIEDETDK